MGKSDDQWSAEEVASVDVALKRMENAHETIMALDRLFFAKDERSVITKLKESGHALARIKEGMPEDLRSKWSAALGGQLRSSVDRAKRSAGKK